MIIKKLFFTTFLVVILFSFSKEIEAKYASFVIDAHTGKVFHAVNENTRNYPASLTKLMTLYILFEEMDKNKLTMGSRLYISRRAASRPASKLGLKAGQKIKVRDAIMAIIVKSANDVATVVAEAIAGSERRFALLMTAKARKIGMRRTTFRNASGLPHRGQMSTASDMALLARKLIVRFPQYYHLFARQTFTYRGRTYRTHNKVLKSFKGAEGMKTGYIRASGYNLVTTAQRNGQRVIGVVFGSNTSRARNRHMKTLLIRAFHRQNFSRRDISRKRMYYPSRSNKNKKSKEITNRIWGVQVGAFYSRKPALNLAKKILIKYKRSLHGSNIVIMPLKKTRKRVLYRARIVGLKKQSAYHVCKLLKKQRQPCMEIILTTKTQVASR